MKVPLRPKWSTEWNKFSIQTKWNPCWQGTYWAWKPGFSCKCRNVLWHWLKQSEDTIDVKTIFWTHAMDTVLWLWYSSKNRSFLLHTWTMNIVHGACPVATRAHYTGEGVNGNQDAETWNDIRWNIIAGRATVSCCLQIKWLGDLEFETPTFLVADVSSTWPPPPRSLKPMQETGITMRSFLRSVMKYFFVKFVKNRDEKCQVISKTRWQKWNSHCRTLNCRSFLSG